MDTREVRELLEKVADGSVAVPAALRQLSAGPLAVSAAGTGIRDLGMARLDVHRALRTGDPEVVLAQSKTSEHTVAIVRALWAATAERPVLATRVPEQTLHALVEAFGPEAEVDDVARCVRVGAAPPAVGTVCVVTAGTSDAPVAAEVAFVARTHGAGVDRIEDVGVAGLHRVLAVRDQIARADCVVVVAGMDGALPSVVGGLTSAPVVAVPTSVGYGAAFEGLAPLLAMLNSCAPGVVVCNIDNGFGAGVFAARVARRSLAPTP